MLYLVGLGLGDAKDITLNGLEIVKRVGRVYLENYTSILSCSHRELEHVYGRQIILADREMIEQDCRQILDAAASDSGAALLVVGDPMNATTHTDLLLRAASRNIPYRVVHNASIINAVACCGLSIYNFGETVSIPFWTETWKPDSFFDKILRNRRNGLHTLCLLDIKVREPNIEMLMRGIRQHEPPRFMTVAQAAEQLVSIMRMRRVDFGRGVVYEAPREQAISPPGIQPNGGLGAGESGASTSDSGSEDKSRATSESLPTSETLPSSSDSLPPPPPPPMAGPSTSRGIESLEDRNLLNEQTPCIGLARIGSCSQAIVRSNLREAIDLDMGPPLHSLVIPGTMHPLEEEILNISAASQV